MSSCEQEEIRDVGAELDLKRQLPRTVAAPDRKWTGITVFCFGFVLGGG